MRSETSRRQTFVQDSLHYLGHSMISVGAPVGSQEPLNDLMWIRSWSLHRRQCGPKKRCHFRPLVSRTGLAKPTVGLRIGRPLERWFFLTPFFGHRFLCFSKFTTSGSTPQKLVKITDKRVRRPTEPTDRVDRRRADCRA